MIALEARLALSTVSWDGGGGNNEWTNAANWSDDVVPGANDDVFVDWAQHQGAIIILHEGSYHVHSYNSPSNGLWLLGDRFQLDAPSSAPQLLLNQATLVANADFVTKPLGQFTGSGQWADFEVIGPGAVSGQQSVELVDSDGDGVAGTIDGATVDVVSLTLTSGKIIVKNTIGHQPTLRADPKCAIIVKTDAGLASADSTRLRVENSGTHQLLATNTSVLDWRTVDYISAPTSITTATLGVLQLSTAPLGTIAGLAAVSVSGDQNWTSSTKVTGNVYLSGGMHLFNAADVFQPSATLRLTDSTAVINTHQNVGLMYLTRSTLLGTGSLVGSIPELNDSTWDFAGSVSTRADLAVTGSSRIARAVPADNISLASGATLHLDSIAGDPVSISLAQLTMKPGSSVVGAATSHLDVGKKLLATGATSTSAAAGAIVVPTKAAETVLDTDYALALQAAMDIPSVVMVGGATLSVESSCAQVQGGILTGKWIVQGTLLLPTAIALDTNRAKVTLDGRLASFAALGGISRNEGTLTLRNDARLSVPGDFANASGANLALFQTDYLRGGSVLIVAGAAALSGSVTMSHGWHNPSASDEPRFISAAGGLVPSAEITYQAFSGAGIGKHPRVVGGTDLILDLTPAKVTDVRMAPESDTGVSSFDRITKITKPRLGSITHDRGRLEFAVDGILLGNVTIPYNASFNTASLIPSMAFADGTYSLQVRIVDEQETAGSWSDPITFTIDTAAPNLVGSAVDYDQKNVVLFTYDEVVAANSSAQLQSSTGLVAASSVVSGSSATVKITPTTSLQDGWWTAILNQQAISDLAGNAARASASVAFPVLIGDVNRDLKVDFDDLVILAQNYGRSGRTYSQGNIDRSTNGVVDFADLTILAQKYGQSLPLDPAATAVGTPPVGLGTANKKSRKRLVDVGL